MEDKNLLGRGFHSGTMLAGPEPFIKFELLTKRWQGWTRKTVNGTRTLIDWLFAFM